MPYGWRRLEDAWLDVFVGGSRELAAELAQQVLGPLSALAGSGSVAEDAAVVALALRAADALS
ncbi:hypothetical protein AB0L30_24960 [Microbispora rosea]|uniref:hypothetical protein n=1 Tax=Microbispora rosea TaxID=58117 RepID=UPI00341D9074